MTIGATILTLIAASLIQSQPVKPAPGPSDQDGDGLNDEMESALLVRFAPSFQIAADDCAVAPAQFTPGSRSPRPTGVHGTIYGQAFPVKPSANDGAYIELHYYHLWDRDCGRKGHPLDLEHVSALLRSDRMSDPPEQWSAVYWYAAAHQGTTCDAGNAALASRIGARAKGPDVWVSRGKHASYLSPELCGKGCGADSCEDSRPLPRTAPVNIGELGASMNGARWTGSRAWRFDLKMGSNFTPEMIALVEDSPAGAMLLRQTTPVQSAIAAGNASADAVAAGQRETGNALSTADEHTTRGLEKAGGSVKKSLKRALKAVGGALSFGAN